MSKEKQIEIIGLKKTLCVKPCDICSHYGKKSQCIPEYTANRLYEAGYRKQEWISVDERLPEESGIYLAYSVLGNRLILDYSARHKLFNSFDSYSAEEAEGFAIGVTHWMPIPEAPKMKGGAE